MKSETEVTLRPRHKVIIKKCHLCGQIIESDREISKCPNCSKSFLPVNYFGKIHVKNTNDFKNLFLSSDELSEDELIKGITVLW